MLTAWPTRGRPNNVLLLRLLLALAVLVAHSVDLLTGHPGEPVWRLTGGRSSLGDLAVDGFMVLSGYLVAESLEQVVSQVREFRASILVRAQGMPEPPRAEAAVPPVVSPPLRLVSPDGTREDV